MALGKKALLIAGVLCILLAVFAWFVLYQPRVQAGQRSAAHVAQVEREIEQTRAQIREIGRLRARAVELEQANAAFEARVIPREEMLGVMTQLSALAQRQRLQFVEILPPGLDTLLEEETAARPVRGVPFYVTLRGRYLDVARYVEYLDDFPYFIRVPDFEVTARQDLRPEVEVKLLLNLFTSSMTGEGL